MDFQPVTSSASETDPFDVEIARLRSALESSDAQEVVMRTERILELINLLQSVVAERDRLQAEIVALGYA